MKYTFSNFIVNGLGADFIKIAMLKIYCYRNGIDFYMNELDDWGIAPRKKNWREFFTSLDMTSDENIPDVTEEILDKIITMPVKFEELSCICNSLFTLQEKYIQSIPIPLPKKYAVIHIRRGDKTRGLWAEGDHHELNEYYDKIKDDYKESEVFVMTDSPKVAEEALDRGFIVDSNENRRDGFVYKHYTSSYPDTELADEAKIFFKNMLVFKEASQLVGSNSSFFYIVGQIMNGRPGVSLSANKLYGYNIIWK